jgi:hypothetical protein
MAEAESTESTERTESTDITDTASFNVSGLSQGQEARTGAQAGRRGIGEERARGEVVGGRK